VDLLWPGFLVVLGFIPIAIAAYVWRLRRKQPSTLRFSSLTLIHQALPPSSRWRRHLPFALFLSALASLIVAAARPVTVVSVPGGQATIILALDVSRSMCSTDIPPNRLEAAKASALSFIQRQRSSTQIGIVAFARTAELIQAPTSDVELLQDAIESLVVGRRTAIGSAILRGLDAIAELDPNDITRIVGIEEKPRHPKSNLAVTGLYIFDSKVFDFIRQIRPSERGQLEITDVNNLYIQAGNITWAKLDGFWSDAGTFDSLYRTNVYWARKNLGAHKERELTSF